MIKFILLAIIVLLTVVFWEKITEIVLDPDKETADIDTRNNSWPKKEENTDFDKFKSRIQG